MNAQRIRHASVRAGRARVLRACLFGALLFLATGATADLRVAPAWFDPDGVANGSDWHYRVPLTIPAAAGVASTVTLDIDFNQLLGNLGVTAGAVDFDENSPRIVRPNGTLAATQEFTDGRFGGTLDNDNNGRGEIRFLLDDAPAAGDYFVYFDIVGNGAKPANPQPAINGNFEHSTGTVATGWSTNGINTGGGENNEVQSTAAGATINIAAGCSANAASNVDNGPNLIGGSATGRDWYLLGYRDNCEDGGAGVEQVQLSRTFQNPSGAARGNLTFFFQIQSFDGLEASGSNYDYLRVQMNGSVLDHTTLGISNASAPTLRIRDVGIGRAGYGNSLLDHGWKQATIDMTQFAAGNTTLLIETRHSDADEGYRMWTKLDDVEWAVQTAIAGAVEGFGANVIAPTDTLVGTATSYGPGQVLDLQVQVDARAASVSVDVSNPGGAVVAASVTLFDDGSHGDVTANDGVWSNDGSDAAFATYTFLAADPVGTAWQITALALDNSVSALGVSNGLVHIDGQPATPVQQSAYWNVDEQTFSFTAPDINIMKLSRVVSDPFNGTTNPKRIPGAIIEYRLTVTNTGGGSVDSGTLALTDPLANTTSLCVSTVCSGGATPILYSDASSPVPTGLTFNYAADVSFSLDGSNFTYTPIPDVSGFDSAITHVRVTPAGAFAGSGAAFELRMFIQVD